MKPTILFFISLMSLLLCCKNSTVENTTDKHLESKSETIPLNIDNDFDTFLTYFNKDSAFQISRIVFPLKVRELELDDSSELIDKVYHKRDHHHMDFTPPKFKSNVGNYTQEIHIDRDTATIEIRGIDNGLIIDYKFEKRNKKWMLITWTDSST